MKNKNKQKQVTKAYQLRLTLVDSSPAVYRVVQIKADTLLSKLHCVIQVLFEWDNEHLYAFDYKQTTYELITDDDFFYEEQRKSADDYTLLDLKLRKNSKLYYTYDFGDNWEIEIKVEKLLYLPTNEVENPEFIKWANASPPEDFGGIYFYNSILEEFNADNEAFVKKYESENWKMLELVKRIEHVKSNLFADTVRKRLQNCQENRYEKSVSGDNCVELENINANAYTMLMDSENGRPFTLAQIMSDIYKLNPWNIFKQTDLFGMKIPSLNNDVYFVSFVTAEYEKYDKLIKIVKGERGVKSLLSLEEEQEDISLAFERMFTDGYTVFYIDMEGIELQENHKKLFKFNSLDIKKIPYVTVTRRKDLLICEKLSDYERDIFEVLVFFTNIFVKTVVEKKMTFPLKYGEIPILHINFNGNVEKIEYITEPNQMCPLGIALPTPNFDVTIVDNMNLSNMHRSTEKKWAIGYTYVPIPNGDGEGCMHYFVSLVIVDVNGDDIVFNDVYGSEYELFENIVKAFFKAVEEYKIIPSEIICHNELIATYLKDCADYLKIRITTEANHQLELVLDFILSIDEQEDMWNEE